MKVSVICGAYNVSRYFAFEKSINSILCSSLEDLELIICDDGSTDNTYELLKEYSSKDKRIKLIKNEENKGLAYSLNRCLEIAEGEYIARHDLDDVSSKERLKIQAEYLDSHSDIDLLGTSSYLFDQNGVWAIEHSSEVVERGSFLFGNPYQHGTMMIRREALVEAGGYRVAKETRRCEDYDLFMRMHKSHKGANIDTPLYYFCEDTGAKQRRKYRYRVDEVKVRFRGFKELGLMPRGFFYTLKPLIVGLIPSSLLDKAKKKRKKREVLPK